MTVLFLSGTSNGASTIEHQSQGGSHIFTATGNFDSATITLQLQSPDDPNSEWVNQANSVLSQANNKFVEYIPSGYKARAVIASAGASTNLFAEIRS